MTAPVRASSVPGRKAVPDETPRFVPLGWPPRVVLGALFLAGSILAAPSGIGLVWFIPYAGVGTLLAIRRPGTSIGWLLLALSWAMVFVLAEVGGTPDAFADGSVSIATAVLAVLQANAGLAMFWMLAALAIVFPSGRIPSGWWGSVGRVVLGIGFVVLAGSFLMPTISVTFEDSPYGTAVANPVALLPRLPFWRILTPDTAIIPLVVLLAGSAVSLVVRFRQSTGLERQQFRWITASLGLLVAGVFGGFVAGALIPGAADSGAIWIGPIVAIPSVPIAIGVAVLRYRLYEIDRIVSRTISWALTTGLVGALFAGLIVALQALLAPVTSESSLAVAASTLAAAAAFQPVRRRVQAAVDHRFNRRRYDAERIVEGYASHLRGVTDLDEIGGGALDAVARSVGPRSAAMWIRSSEGRG